MLSLMNPWRALAVSLAAQAATSNSATPTDNNQIIDLTIAQCEVNAAHRNKRFLFDKHHHERITNSIDGGGGKKYFAPARAERAPPGAQVPATRGEFLFRAILLFTALL